MSETSGISLTCPQCRKRRRIVGGVPGRQFTCRTPGCGTTITIPGAPATPTRADAPRPPQRRPEPSPFSLDDVDPTPPPRPRSRPQPLSLDDDPPRRSPWLWVALAAVVLVLLGGAAGLGYWLLTGRKTDTVENTSGGSTPITASGPRVVLLEKLPDSLKVRHFYLVGEFYLGNRFEAVPEEWPQVLPSGTEQVHVGVVFESEPPQGTTVKLEVESESGPVKLQDRRFTLIVRTPRGVAVEPECMARDGAFPDGRYKTKVIINGKPAAELNWAVGAKLPGVAASTLKGTKWRITRGSGERLEFQADGTFVVSSPDIGPTGERKQVGKWEAKGDTFTAYIEKSGDQPRTEYRGQCFKDEIRIRKRSEIIGGNQFTPWSALGVFRKDAPIPPEG